MWASIRERLKGWKTIIWAGGLVVMGLVLTALSALDVVQLSNILPEKYKPYAPMILAVIGYITGQLRVITTGPVGSKGDEISTPETKAGD